MFNISDIIQSAHGGAAIDNIAQQFGITSEQAQSAVNALVPALSHGLQNQTADPNAMSAVVNTVAGDGPHKDAFNDPNAAFSGAAVQQGNSTMGQIFGNSEIVDQIAQHASKISGVSPDIIKQILPSLTAIVMGGLFHSMQNQGLGGTLGQLASQASSGNLGSILGQFTSGQGGAGGLGGIVGSLLGGLFGGGSGAAPAAAPSGQSSELQTGMDALTKMFQPGVQTSGDEQQSLGTIMGRFFQPKS